MCLALWASGLWLRYATLQNLIPSFPWIAPHALHSGAIQGKEGIKLPSGNLEAKSEGRKEGKKPQAKQSKARPSSAISQTAVAVGNKKGAASVTGSGGHARAAGKKVE